MESDEGKRMRLKYSQLIELLEKSVETLSKNLFINTKNRNTDLKKRLMEDGRKVLMIKASLLSINHS